MGGAWRLSLEKESILNNIIDDLERRNRNWDSIDAELANNALLTASNDEENKKKKKGKKEKSKLTIFDILEPVVAALLVITVIFTLFLKTITVLL